MYIICMYIYIFFSLPIDLLRDIYVISISWLLWMILHWTWVSRYLFKVLISIPIDMNPGMGLLDHIVVQFLTFWGNTILFSIYSFQFTVFFTVNIFLTLYSLTCLFQLVCLHFSCLIQLLQDMSYAIYYIRPKKSNFKEERIVFCKRENNYVSPNSALSSDEAAGIIRNVFPRTNCKNWIKKHKQP